MKKKVIYKYSFYNILSPLSGRADVDEYILYYSNHPVNNENEFRAVIRKEIIPEYHNLNPEEKNYLKIVFGYYLATNSIDFEGIYNNCLMPFDPPNPPRNFFQWIWEELFPGEQYKLDPNVEYVVDDNPNHWNEFSAEMYKRYKKSQNKNLSNKK